MGQRGMVIINKKVEIDRRQSSSRLTIHSHVFFSIAQNPQYDNTNEDVQNNIGSRK